MTVATIACPICGSEFPYDYDLSVQALRTAEDPDTQLSVSVTPIGESAVPGALDHGCPE